MGDKKDRVGAAGVIVAGGFFKIALYVCVAVLVIWIGKVTYQFGYNIFNQQAMSPGEGQEVTVVIKEDTSLYRLPKLFRKKVWSRVHGILCSGETVYLSWKASGRNVSVKYSIYT